MGLDKHDSDDLIEPIFGIDLQAKTGDEEEVVVLSFTIENELGAKDLASFIDKSVVKGILDAEPFRTRSDGLYAVFVEIERNENPA